MGPCDRNCIKTTIMIIVGLAIMAALLWRDLPQNY